MNDILIEDIDDDISNKNGNIQNNNMKNKKRKIKKINIYLSILTIIMLLVVILNNYIIFKYNVLPLKYLIIFILIVDIIPLLLIYFSLIKRKKNKKKLSLKILISIIEIIYIIVLSFAFFYLNKTFNFLETFTSSYNYQTKNYYIIVLKDSKYEKIVDLDNKKIGYVKQLISDSESVIDKLNESVKLEYEEYKNYNILFDDLLNIKIDSVLIGDSYYDSLLEENDDYKDKFKILHKLSLTEKAEDIKKDVDVLKDTINIYISGIDSYGNVNSLTRSDVNIVVSINPLTHQILMINIPRDYYVTLHDINEKDKLTHAGIYGIDMSVKTIEDLLGTEINYYFKVNYGALEKLVNALGGVNVYSKYNFTTVGTDKNYVFKKGYNYVNGSQALYFVRTRKAFEDGDRVRGENQQAMIQAIIKKACSSAVLTSYTEILEVLKDTFITNLSIDKITDLIRMQLDKMPDWNITSISLSGIDGSDYTYSCPGQKLYVMIPDETTILYAKENLDSVKKGKSLENSYQDNDSTVNNVTEIKQNSENHPKKEESTAKVEEPNNNTNNNIDTNNSVNKDKTNEIDKKEEKGETENLESSKDGTNVDENLIN